MQTKHIKPNSAANPKEQLAAGVDAGGTRCHTTLFDGEDIMLDQSECERANFASNASLAEHSILEAISDAMLAAGFSVDSMGKLVVGAGLADLHLPEVTNRLQQWKHPFNSFVYTTDSFVAVLGAYRFSDGAV